MQIGRRRFPAPFHRELGRVAELLIEMGSTNRLAFAQRNRGQNTNRAGFSYPSPEPYLARPAQRRSKADFVLLERRSLAGEAVPDAATAGADAVAEAAEDG